MASPPDSIGHGARHHSGVGTYEPNVQRSPFDVEELQEYYSVMKEFGLSVNGAGGVDVDQIVSENLGESCAVAGNQGDPTGTFTLTDCFAGGTQFIWSHKRLPSAVAWEIARLRRDLSNRNHDWVE